MQTTEFSDTSDFPQTIVLQPKSVGATMYDLNLPEPHTLLHPIRSGEAPLGVVYGNYSYHHARGRGVLMATNWRVLLISKKSFYLTYTEISYQAITSVSWVHPGFATNVVLTTQKGDISMRTCNEADAQQFVGVVEAGLFTRRKEGVNGSFN